MSFDAQIVQALEDNIQRKFSYFQRELPSMEIIQDDALTLINSHQMTDMFNTIFCRGSISENQVLQALQYFKKNNLPFAWWVGFAGEPENLLRLLEQQGLKKSEEELAMVAELNLPIVIEASSNFIVKPVVHESSLQDFVKVITDIVPHEEKAIKNFYQQAESLILVTDAPIQLYVGYIDSKPISTCSVFFSKEVAGIFDIIAAPSVRGKGIGSAMTKMAMLAAKQKGYEACVLTATNDAKFLYEKLGFKALKSMGVYTF